MYLSVSIVLLAGILPSLCGGLVCYDTVVAEEPVLIGCDFAGASCAVTNKSTTTTSYGTNITEHTTLYHCAERSSSCTSGPLNYCVEHVAGEQVTCETSCCDTDKCNFPKDAKFEVETVPKNEALSCFQLIGASQKTVDCMFKDAMCLYSGIAPTDFSYGSTKPQNLCGTQYCATRKLCQKVKTLCSLYNSILHNFGKTCLAECCSDNRCNRLPWNAHYINTPHPHAKGVKSTHMKGTKQKHRKNMVKREVILTTSPKRDVFPEDSIDDMPAFDDSIDDIPAFDDSIDDLPAFDDSIDDLPAFDDDHSYDDSLSYTDDSYNSNIGWYLGAGAVAIFISTVAAAVRYSRYTKTNVRYTSFRNV